MLQPIHYRTGRDAANRDGPCEARIRNWQHSTTRNDLVMRRELEDGVMGSRQAPSDNSSARTSRRSSAGAAWSSASRTRRIRRLAS